MEMDPQSVDDVEPPQAAAPAECVDTTESDSAPCDVLAVPGQDSTAADDSPSIDPYAPFSLTSSSAAQTADTLSAAVRAASTDAQLQQVGLSGSAKLPLRELFAELDTYEERFLRTRSSLEHAAHQEIADRLVQERSFIEDHCKKELISLDKELVVRTMPRSATPAIKRMDCALEMSKTKSTSRLVEAGERVVAYWKSKCATLADTINSQKADLAIIQAQLDDMQHLCSGEQHKALRMVGLLREKLSTEVMRGNGYKELLMQLATAPGTQDKSKPTLANASPVVQSFSNVEAMIVDRELEAVARVTACHDKLISQLKHARHIRQQHCEAIGSKVADLQRKVATVATAPFDKTLEEALDLRSKIAAGVSSLSAAEVESLRKRHEELESASRSALDDTRRRFAIQRAVEEREMRERKVAVIRMLYEAGDGMESRFHHLRAQQCLSVLTSHIASAESERLRLKMDLARITSQVKGNVSFLDRGS